MEISKKRYFEIRYTADKYFDSFMTRNPLKILKKLGIPCRIVKLEEGLDGITCTDSNSKTSVLINKKYAKDKYLLRIIAGHELGHILLHREIKLNMFDEDESFLDEKEYEADIFLMELMPNLKPSNYKSLSPKSLRGYIRSILDF